MLQVLALRPVTGCGHCNGEGAALADCLFLAAEVDADEEATVKDAKRSSVENIAVRTCSNKLFDVNRVTG